MKKERSNKVLIIVIAVVILAMIIAGVYYLKTSKDTKDKEDTNNKVTNTPTAAPSATQAPESTEAPTVKGTPVSYYGEMVVKDGVITGSKTNEKMRVTGMSFFWSNWSQKYYTAEYVDLMVDEFNCEVVRCAYGIQDNGVPYDTSCVPLIESVVEQAIERGVYVILDWHSHGAHNNPQEAINFYSDMAEKYGSYDNVVFEIYNEPKNVNWDKIKEYAELVIPEIRKYSDNLIIVGTPNWSQDVVAASKNPIAEENIAYTLHFYAGTHKEWLRNNADQAMAAGIALAVTEWGSVNADGNGGINKESTQEWMEWIDENQLVSCNWAVNDKNETSSIFSSNSTVSNTGEYLKELISERTLNAPWR